MRSAITIKGGLARGFGAIGFTRFLEEEGFEPDVIAGSSSGAMVAAMYAVGVPWKEVVEIMTKFNFLRLTSPISVVRSGSLISYNTYRKQFENIADTFGIKKDMNIEDLDKKLVIFATDTKTKKKVALDKGDLIEAILASSAYPGIFPAPIKHCGLLLYDGDMIPNYGASILKQKYKVSKIIGVSTRKTPKIVKVKQNIFANTLDTYQFLREQLFRLYGEKEDIDFELSFNADDQSTLGFKKIKRVTQRTYRQARKHRKEIKAILDN
ncbi:hypothetical protein GF389_06020 [Candidatus Dojkabacteria bacterium]|nr:hypothetical protein [Candidatus Dojkabacteria bacterium]